MARKVFIAVLGTGNYGACQYKKGKFESSKTRFIQQATLEYLKEQDSWAEVERKEDGKEERFEHHALILLTEAARTKNWNAQEDNRNPSYDGLEKILADMNLNFPIRTIDIKNGRNEEEMWDIFNALYEELKPGDHLFFDLTHGFRYLPMLVLVLGNYAKFLKEVTVRHISYGNYEAMDKSTNMAPLMDILPLTILQDWTFAAADLIRNGNIQRLHELTKNTALMPVLRAKGKSNLEKKAAEQPLTEYIDSLQKFLKDMKLCLAPRIIKGESINTVNDFYILVKGQDKEYIAPLPPIIDQIQGTLSEFKVASIDNPIIHHNGYQAALWCFEHQLYQQAFTILDESITTHFCDYLGMDKHVYSQRKAAGAFLRHDGYKEEDWRDEELNNVRQNAKAAYFKPEVRNFIYNLQGISNWIHGRRNTYNHASMGRNDSLTLEDIDELKKKIDSVINLTKKL